MRIHKGEGEGQNGKETKMQGDKDRNLQREGCADVSLRMRQKEKTRISLAMHSVV